MEVLHFLVLLLLSPFTDVSVASFSSPVSNNNCSQLFLSSSSPLSSSPVNGSSYSPPSPPYPRAPYDTSSRFNPSMAIIIVVLLSAFFFMGFFSVYVRRCTTEDELDSDPTSDLYHTGGVSGNMFLLGASSRRQDRPPQGLDLFLVNNLPVVRFSSPKERRGETECVVCLNDFEEGEALRLLPQCGHLFHQECVDMWLFSHTTCPLCRRGLTNDKNGLAGFTSTAEEGNQSSRIDGVNAPVPILSAQGTEVTIDIDNTILAVADEQRTHAQGVSESNLLPVEDLEAGFSQCGSPILGVMETPTGSNKHPCIETGRKLRRSHSTGHFVVRRSRDRLNEHINSPSSDRWDPSCSPLFVAIASNFHRTRSYTMLSDLEGALHEEQQIGTDGWRFSFRRYKREALEHNGWTCPEPTSSARGANSAMSSSPSSSVRRTFKRLTGIENSAHLLSDRQREFAHLAYVL